MKACAGTLHALAHLFNNHMKMCEKTRATHTGITPINTTFSGDLSSNKESLGKYTM